MKLTKETLKRIIKEELDAVLGEEDENDWTAFNKDNPEFIKWRNGNQRRSYEGPPINRRNANLPEPELTPFEKDNPEAIWSPRGWYLKREKGSSSGRIKARRDKRSEKQADDAEWQHRQAIKVLKQLYKDDPDYAKLMNDTFGKNRLIPSRLKEELEGIIKEELDAVLEAHLDQHGQPTTRDYRKAMKGKPHVIKPMALDAAKAQLGLDKEKSWAVLSEPENDYIKKKILALAQSLYDSSTAPRGGEDFKNAKKGEYNTLIAAIEAAGGTFTPIKRDEKEKGEQEDG